MHSTLTGDMSDFSEWLPLQKEIFKSVPDEPGVYKIRITDSTGQPRIISRASGQDTEGILYIGSTKYDLRNRIRTFYRNALDPESEWHVAGWTYYQYNFAKEFPFDSLQFQFAKATKDNATELENNLLKNYLEHFLDKPPLNFKIKRW